MKSTLNSRKMTNCVNEQFKKSKMRLIQGVDSIPTIDENVNASLDHIPIVKSDERAKAIFSLLLLLEHRDHWNWRDGFIVDWTDCETKKWCITVINDKLDIIISFTNKKLLCFGNKESSTQFLETFSRMIDTAKDLL